MAEAAPVLAIEGLTVALPKGSDRPHAIENIGFSVGAGEIVCVVGESGSGKSVTAQAIMGLLPRELSATAGAVRLEGEDVLKATPARLRDLRGTRMAMIFQEPMTALNPVMTVGEQIAEVLEIHTAAVRGRPPPARPTDHARRAPAGAGAPDRRLSAPDLWRPAPAHHDRRRPGPRPRPADRRRAHHRARRHHPGADPAPDPRAAGSARHRRAVHHPRLRRGGRDRPPRGGDAIRPHRRDRRARRRPAPAPVRLYAHADRLGAEPEAAAASAQDRPGGAGDGAPQQDLRHARAVVPRPGGEGGRERRHRRAARRDGRHRRRVGLGQDDGGALRRPSGGADLRRHPYRRCRRRPPAREPAAPAPPPRADRVPGPLPLAQSAPHGRRLHHRRAHELRPGGGRRQEPRAAADGAGRARARTRSTAIRTSSPAASASASPSPGRSPWSRNS